MIFINTGILVGSLISLLVSRYLFYNFVKKNILTYHRNFIAIDAVIAEEGWRTVFLLRLTPFPFGVVSYLFSNNLSKVEGLLHWHIECDFACYSLDLYWSNY